MPAPPRAILLDTCVLINLAATGRLSQIASLCGWRFVVCSAVARESIFLRSPDSEAESERVRLDSLIGSGALTVCAVEGEEEEALYVAYAAHLDDGEAMSLALAEARGFTLATDDKKARRLFLEAVGDPGRLLSTPAILRRWATRLRLPQRALRDALLAVTNRARYFPPPTDPHFRWWLDSTARGLQT